MKTYRELYQDLQDLHKAKSKPKDYLIHVQDASSAILGYLQKLKNEGKLDISGLNLELPLLSNLVKTLLGDKEALTIARNIHVLTNNTTITDDELKKQAFSKLIATLPQVDQIDNLKQLPSSWQRILNKIRSLVSSTSQQNVNIAKPASTPLVVTQATDEEKILNAALSGLQRLDNLLGLADNSPKLRIPSRQILQKETHALLSILEKANYKDNMIKLTQTELSKLLSNKDLEPKEIAHQLHEHYWVIIKHLNEEQFGQNYKDTYPELAPTPPSAAAKEEPTADNTTSRFRPSR